MRHFFNSAKISANKTAGTAFAMLSALLICLVVIMFIGLIWKAWPILKGWNVWELITGTDWQPFKNKFGFYPFIISSILVTGLAVLTAFPIALFSAVFLTEYAHPQAKKIIFPILDILASLPSVIYGVWGVLIIVPIVSNLTPNSYVFSAGYTVVAASIVAAVMILPMMVSLFIEIFSSVSIDLRESSYAIGATRWQTATHVVMKKSLTGIFAATVLAVSRAFGETIAVLMVCGNMTKTPESIFDPCYPLPALLANNYGEMLSLPLYESALMFSALALFVVIVIFNIISRLILKSVSEK